MPKNHEFDFTLVLTGVTELTDDMANALFEAGCDDGSPASRDGRVYVMFTRESGSLRDAILSAIHDVRSAGIGADVMRVDDYNFVSQSEIGRRIGRSRQNVNQYINGLRGPGTFPAPVCDVDTEYPLWDWCEVARWLVDSDVIEDVSLQEAEDVATINSVLDLEYRKARQPALIGEIIEKLAPNAGDKHAKVRKRAAS